MKFSFLILFLGIAPFCITAQSPDEANFALVWYNTENLFDCLDDSLTMDEEFTPEGDKHWTNYRYRDKIKKLAKAMLAVSKWNEPAIVGLCEVENEQVLKDLVYNSPLAGLKLNYIHKDSRDARGIDVALLYNPQKFSPIHTQFIPVNGQPDAAWVSRDIVYCKGVFNTNDTVHVFVNHWPSKYGGAVKSEPKRMHAAKVLLTKVDSLLAENSNASLVLMGDFNETFTEPAISLLKQSNLRGLEVEELNKGTHKYKGNWAQIDYFFLSAQLFSNTGGLYLKHWEVGETSFLLEPDANYSGSKPFRTYVGYKYNGGFSDHLPLVLYLGKK